MQMNHLPDLWVPMAPAGDQMLAVSRLLAHACLSLGISIFYWLGSSKLMMCVPFAIIVHLAEVID